MENWLIRLSGEQEIRLQKPRESGEQVGCMGKCVDARMSICEKAWISRSVKGPVR